jgi:hypothetical protein
MQQVWHYDQCLMQALMLLLLLVLRQVLVNLLTPGL